MVAVIDRLQTKGAIGGAARLLEQEDIVWVVLGVENNVKIIFHYARDDIDSLGLAVNRSNAFSKLIVRTCGPVIMMVAKKPMPILKQIANNDDVQ